MASTCIVDNHFLESESDNNYDELNDNISMSAWSEISLPSSVLSLHSNNIAQSHGHALSNNNSNFNTEELFYTQPKVQTQLNKIPQFSYAEITQIQPTFIDDNDNNNKNDANNNTNNNNRNINNSPSNENDNNGITNDNENNNNTIDHIHKLKKKNTGTMLSHIPEDNIDLPESDPYCAKPDLGKRRFHGVSKRRSRIKWPNGKNLKENKSKAKNSKNKKN